MFTASSLRRQLTGRAGQFALAAFALNFGLNRLLRELTKLGCEHDRLVALHAESRARIFALETVLEAGGVVFVDEADLDRKEDHEDLD